MRSSRLEVDQLVRNVLGGPLQECGLDPVTGFTRSGSCEVTVDDVGVHGICAVMTEDFLIHQLEVGNDLLTPRAAWQFPGLRPGDRWCVVAGRWVQAQRVDRAPPVVLASTHVSVLKVVSLSMLQRYAVDVPDDLSGLN